MNTENKEFHNNITKDSCIIFWEEYDKKSKVVFEYDFPSDRCWTIKGPSEHHYFYDTNNRIIEDRVFGGEEGEERTLMRDHFFSYPYIDEPNKANEILLEYDFRESARTGQERIDTFYLDIINTKGLFDIPRTYWEFDTVISDKGNYVFRKDFKYDKGIFKTAVIGGLLNKETIEDFEIALMTNIDKLSENLGALHKIEDVYSYEFGFEEISKRRKIQFVVTENFINFEYKFIKDSGDNDLTYYYEYSVNGDMLKKLGFMKSYKNYY